MTILLSFKVFYASFSIKKIFGLKQQEVFTETETESFNASVFWT